MGGVWEGFAQQLKECTVLEKVRMATRLQEANLFFLAAGSYIVSVKCFLACSKMCMPPPSPPHPLALPTSVTYVLFVLISIYFQRADTR